MTHYLFDSMSESLQLEVVRQKGVLLAERMAGFYKVCLYEVGGFYAEVFYHHHFNVPVRIRTFQEADGLDPYLEQLNIDDLLFV